MPAIALSLGLGPAMCCPWPLAQPVGLALRHCNLLGLRADRTPTGRQLPPPQRERTRATRYGVLGRGVLCPRNALKDETPLSGKTRLRRKSVLSVKCGGRAVEAHIQLAR